MKEDSTEDTSGRFRAHRVHCDLYWSALALSREFVYNYPNKNVTVGRMISWFDMLYCNPYPPPQILNLIHTNLILDERRFQYYTLEKWLNLISHYVD